MTLAAESSPAVARPAAAAVETPLRRFLSDYFESWVATAALALLVIIVLLAGSE